MIIPFAERLQIVARCYLLLSTHKRPFTILRATSPDSFCTKCCDKNNFRMQNCNQ